MHIVFTDNESLVHVINKQTCKDRVLMVFIRKLVAICLHHNILFKAKHIQGVRNRLADALSRLQVQTFRHLAPPHKDSLPTDIPQYLQPQIRALGRWRSNAFLKYIRIPSLIS